MKNILTLLVFLTSLTASATEVKYADISKGLLGVLATAPDTNDYSGAIIEGVSFNFSALGNANPKPTDTVDVEGVKMVFFDLTMITPDGKCLVKSIMAAIAANSGSVTYAIPQDIDPGYFPPRPCK